MTEYIVYCDESLKHGVYYSNFYGGAIIKSTFLQEIVDKLIEKKSDLKISGEIKWEKVNEYYLEQYKELMTFFFKFVNRGVIKVRIMFTHNFFQPTNLTRDQIKNEYYILYYHFLKHAFGFIYCDIKERPLNLRIYFDKFPHDGNNEGKNKFIDFVYQLQNTIELSRNIVIKRENITEINSKDHIILQCIDVITGAMQFRLNEQHKVKDPKTNRRGKRTKAKESLYKHINKHLTEIRPYFNIGKTTGGDGDKSNRWRHVYRHWCFVPGDRKIDETKAKNK